MKAEFPFVGSRSQSGSQKVQLVSRHPDSPFGRIEQENRRAGDSGSGDRLPDDDNPLFCAPAVS